LIAVAWILNVAAGVSKTVGCLLAALVCTLYFTAGGLHSTVRVNLLQLCVKFVGFILALAFAVHLSGGLAGLNEKLNAKVGAENADSYVSFFGAGGAAIARYIAALVPSFIISPGLLQKIFGARDEKSVRIGVGVNAMALLLFAIVPVAIGMIARGWLELSNRELAMPAVLGEILPLWLGALLLAAIFSAEVSTADAVLFMLTTSLGKDFYKGILKPEATDRELMLFTRRAAAICGLGSGLLAFLLETVTGALTVFYSIITAVFLLPIVSGLYSKRVSARSALISIAVTVGALFLIETAPRVPALESATGLLTYAVREWGVPSLVVAIFAGLAAMVVAVAFEKKSTRLAAATSDDVARGD
jgi:SSS family solute:Na+ symporter